MKMVQRKVSNKLGIQATCFKTEKRQTNILSSLQNHDGKTKGADLKAKKMKESRSIKKPELESSPRSLPRSHEVPRQPGKPPPLLSPTKTPSPKKPSPGKSPYSSPNYMKSTTSSEARKEIRKAKEQQKISISSSSKVHKVAKTLNRSSSLKKVRTLTKAPSFKHTRTGGNKCSKVVLCEDLNVKRATCSSTQKDLKFPTYLVLNPGATEAKGTSVMKVCPYNYCSLNGHYHKPALPLKCFLSSRRKLLKTQRVGKPQILSPRKVKPLEKDVLGVESKEEAVLSGMSPVKEMDDFFVEIYVPRLGEVGNEEPCSEVDFQNDFDQSGDTISLDAALTPAQEEEHSYNGNSLEVDNSTTVSLDEFFGERSDMEWEEAQFDAACPEDEGNNSDLAANDEQDARHCFEEFLAEKLLSFYHDEITEWQHFSDVGSMPDSESTQAGEEQIEETHVTKEDDDSKDENALEHDTTFSYATLEFMFSDEQDGASIDEIIEAESKDVDTHQEPAESQNVEANEDEKQGGEIGAQKVVMEGKESTESKLPENEDVEKISSTNENQEPEDQKCDDGHSSEVEETEINKCIIPRLRNSEEEDHSSMVKLQPVENSVVDVNAPETEAVNKTEESDEFPITENKTGHIKNGLFSRKEAASNRELLNSCNKLKISTRRKEDEESSKSPDFNPRGPNFLPIEPDPEAEKVDLRHQEMDERKNAEEWMLDYALRKTVNQLAPARKKKVALLVEAFEAVTPIPKCEPHLRRSSSGFALARPIQACR